MFSDEMINVALVARVAAGAVEAAGIAKLFLITYRAKANPTLQETPVRARHIPDPYHRLPYRQSIRTHVREFATNDYAA